MLKIDRAMYEYAVSLRRFFHENPELTGKEFQTSEFLKKKCVELGLKVEEVPNDSRSTGTGFIAILDTKKPGKTLGLRTDIDALPIEESKKNLSGNRKIISKNPGVMHACGHDGHMAILLSVMKLMSENVSDFTGRVIFIFEEGEEASTGVYAMTDFLKNYKIDAIYGNHLYSGLETGKVVVNAGPLMSASLRVKMSVRGKSGHVSRPDLSVNPLIAGAYIITNLSGAWTNQLPVDEMVTFGFSQFNASSARNIITDEVFIAGSIRYFKEELGLKTFDLIKKVSKNVALAHGCEVEFSDDSGPSAVSVINEDLDLVKLCRDVVTQLNPEGLVENYQWYASETFGHYQALCPTLFVLLGTKNEEVGSGAEHHNELFDIDERSLKHGIETMYNFSIKYLQNK